MDISQQAEREGLPPSDLTVIMETLSYIENWREVIANINSTYMLITLFIPPDPIGFVKSPRELIEAFSRHFKILQHIEFHTAQRTIVFGKRLKTEKYTKHQGR